MSSPTTQDTLATLRRCIGALMACEDRLREDMANLLAFAGADSTEAPQITTTERYEYDLRAGLAQLASLTIAEARATSECLQAQAQAKKGDAQ